MVAFTSTTLTVLLACTRVLFSFEVTLTTLFHVPVALDLATIHNVMDFSLNLGKFQLMSCPFSLYPADALSNANPSGSLSQTTTSLAFILDVMFTTIVKLTKVLLPTNVIFAVLLTVKTIGTTSTVALALTSVLFSADIALTLLSHGPVALDLATIQYVAFAPLIKVIGAQLTF